jgi:hypothetical protein
MDVFSSMYDLMNLLIKLLVKRKHSVNPEFAAQFVILSAAKNLIVVGD